MKLTRFAVVLLSIVAVPPERLFSSILHQRKSAARLRWKKSPNVLARADRVIFKHAQVGYGVTKAPMSNGLVEHSQHSPSLRESQRAPTYVDDGGRVGISP